MTARGKGWAIGLVITTLMVVILSLGAESRQLAIPSALLGMALCALAAEVFSLRTQARRATGSGPPRGARPPDGVVEVARMGGVEAEPNSALPRFRVFSRLGDWSFERATNGRLSEVHPPLLGRVTLISIFIGRDGRGWTDEEIALGHGALEKAGLWIEREASRHAALVNVSLADTYFRVQDDEVDDIEIAFAPEGGEVGPMEAHASTKAIVAASRAAASLGFADLVELIKRIDPRIDADARVWLLHIRRAGRSLAIPTGECELDGVGLAVCYSNEASFPEPIDGPGRVDPTTIAHEVLHLFGASDKYGVAIKSFPPGSVSSLDIMRLNHDRLSRMTIDPLTAKEVGWDSSFSEKNTRR